MKRNTDNTPGPGNRHTNANKQTKNNRKTQTQMRSA